MTTANLLTQLIAEVCINCGITFGLEAAHRADLIKRRGRFFCPNGHSMNYIGKTEVEKERDRLAAQLQQTEKVLLNTRQSLEHMGARARGAERSVQARKGVITRMKRRIRAGRCVCCSHEFKDLAAHMKRKHPHFEPENHVSALEKTK